MDNTLEKLREIMRANAVDAYLVPRADAYLGEFVAASSERLAFLTGFTGSAGIAIIRENDAIVMSDGRYTLQLEEQVDSDLFKTADSTKYNPIDWLFDHMSEGQVLGYDARLHSIDQIEKLQKRLSAKKVNMKALDENLIDQVWEDRPDLPASPIEIFPDALAGQSASEKIDHICKVLSEKGCDGAFIASPDSICWLLNIRGEDLENTPVIHAYAGIDAKARQVHLYIHEPEKRSFDHEQVFLLDQKQLEEDIGECEGRVIALDPMHTPHWFDAKLRAAGADVKHIKDPSIAPKARKSEQEKSAIRKAHIADGVAIVKFLHWLDENANKAELSELSVGEQLEAFRREHSAYRAPSFPTIAGFGPNGAVIHYRASATTNRQIKGDGLLLVDSGGQYLDADNGIAGTTDITRTIAIGDVSDEMKRHFTLVLKGHIALASSHFPSGNTGAQVDTAARQALWNAGLDYAHGTGHGVGCYLAVHEEAASISPRGKDALEEGMLLSNEPGYYLAGSHGIRCENLVIVQKAGQCEATGNQMLCFETVTLAPFDRRLIISKLLTQDEKDWLNEYHAWVWETLSPLVEDGAVKEWLKGATQKIV
jgi:Xaa-Pro aminopeptidase